jgi:hypothetical protein
VEFEKLDVTADPGFVLQAYSTDPGSLSHDALSLLTSWAATLDQEQALPTAAEPTTPRCQTDAEPDPRKRNGGDAAGNEKSPPGIGPYRDPRGRRD